jgi:hypothetical protein
MEGVIGGGGAAGAYLKADMTNRGTVGGYKYSQITGGSIASDMNVFMVSNTSSTNIDLYIQYGNNGYNGFNLDIKSFWNTFTFVNIEGTVDPRTSPTSYATYWDLITSANFTQKASSGNVGIGYNSPQSILHVQVGDVVPTASGNMATGMIISQSSGGPAMCLGARTTGGNYTWIHSAYTNNSGIAAPLVLQPIGGNVGIGTTNPGSALQVVGTVTATTFSGAGTSLTGTATSLTAGSATTAVNQSGGTVSATTGSFSGVITLPGTGTNEIGPGTGDGGSLTTYDVYFKTWWGLAIRDYSNTVRMVADARAGTWNTTGGYQINGTTVIDGSRNLINIGNVGIGTSSPGTNISLDIINSVVTSNLPFMRIGNSAGGSGNQVGINLAPWTGRSGGPPVQIVATDDGNASAYLTFLVAATGGVSTAAERMRINNAGNVGIGTNPTTYLLQVGGTIGSSGDITAYYSDDRLKTRTGAIVSALDKICSLDAFTYVHNDLAKSFGFKDETQKVGVSAQQVQAVLPEAVKRAPFDADGEDGSKSGQNYLTVQYEKLVPLLIAALKEERAAREQLEKLVRGY